MVVLVLLVTQRSIPGSSLGRPPRFFAPMTPYLLQGVVRGCCCTLAAIDPHMHTKRRVYVYGVLFKCDISFIEQSVIVEEGQVMHWNIGCQHQVLLYVANSCASVYIQTKGL